MNQDVRRLFLPKDLRMKAEREFEENEPRESVVFLFGKVVNRRIIATDILIPKPKDYVRRTPGSCEVSHRFLARNVHRFWDEAKDLVLTWHSHPIHGLSSVDTANHLRLMRVFPNVLSGFYAGAMPNEMEFYQYDDGFKPVDWTDGVDLSLYNRQTTVHGEDGQLSLLAAKVMVVGCGGGGSLVARMLAMKGVGELALVDPDSLERTNFNRVWLDLDQEGQPKTKALRLEIGKFRPYVKSLSHVAKIQDVRKEDLDDVDVFIVFTDSIASRLHVNELAVKSAKPALFAATEIRTNEGGRVDAMVGDCLVYLPNVTPCYRCNLSLDYDQYRMETEDPTEWKRHAQRYGLGVNSVPQPSIVELNAIIAALASDEITKILTGYAEPVHHQYWDHLARKLLVLNGARDPECPACKSVPTVELTADDFVSRDDPLGGNALWP